MSATVNSCQTIVKFLTITITTDAVYLKQRNKEIKGNVLHFSTRK
jgi:hypothetical protein